MSFFNGKNSKNLPVTLDVPQGSVLGPVGILVFINDLPEEVDCQVARFAGENLMYQTIKCSHDTLKFQENLTAPSKWADKWGMDFNVKKSKILLFNCKGKLPHYSLHRNELQIVEEVKYFGVMIQSDMKFTAHIHRKLITVNQQLGIIMQESTVLGPYQCQTVCLQDYLTLSSKVCSSCLEPKQQKDISDIEQLQIKKYDL